MSIKTEEVTSRRRKLNSRVHGRRGGPSARQGSIETFGPKEEGKERAKETTRKRRQKKCGNDDELLS